MKINSIKFNSIIQVLKSLSEKSTMRFRHACVILSGGKIISSGINTFDGEPIHAEMDAIRKIDRSIQLNKCILIVIRFNRSGDIYPSKPCSECVKQIQHRCFKRVYYSTTDGGFEIERSYDLYNNFQTYYYRMTT